MSEVETLANSPSFAEISLSEMKKKGYRITGPRKKVAQVLNGMKGPFSVKELHGRIQEEVDEKFDFATTYRTLGTYADLALVHSISGTDRYLVCNHHCTKNEHVHVLFICKTCGDAHEKVLGNDVSVLLREISSRELPDFSVSELTLNATGQCQKCQKC